MESEVCGIKITSSDKILFRRGKITKLDVANYYKDISTKMLPLINNRLLSVIRCHQGSDGEKFFKKHPTTERDYVEVFQDGNNEYFYIKDKTELIYQVQIGSLELHTWGSKVPQIDKPDLMVFDLDPNEDVTLSKLQNGVLEIKNILADLGLKSYLKTSGGKGYHIVLPLTNFDNWEDFNDFAKNVAILMENKNPKLYTSNIRKSERKGRIFVDYLRNSKGATCVAPYSLRARENAPISFPIKWENLKEIRPNEINIKNYQKYLESNNLPWKNIKL